MIVQRRRRRVRGWHGVPGGGDPGVTDAQGRMMSQLDAELCQHSSSPAGGVQLLAPPATGEALPDGLAHRLGSADAVIADRGDLQPFKSRLGRLSARWHLGTDSLRLAAAEVEVGAGQPVLPP